MGFGLSKNIFLPESWNPCSLRHPKYLFVPGSLFLQREHYHGNSWNQSILKRVDWKIIISWNRNVEGMRCSQFPRAYMHREQLHHGPIDLTDRKNWCIEMFNDNKSQSRAKETQEYLGQLLQYPNRQIINKQGPTEKEAASATKETKERKIIRGHATMLRGKLKE